MKTLILIIICLFCTTTYANATYYEQNSLEKPNNVVILQRKTKTKPEKTTQSKISPASTPQKPKIKPTVKMTITRNPALERSSRKNIRTTTKNTTSCQDTPGTRCYRIKHRAKARPYPKGDARYKHPSRLRPKQPAKPIEFIHCY